MTNSSNSPLSTEQSSADETETTLEAQKEISHEADTVEPKADELVEEIALIEDEPVEEIALLEDEPVDTMDTQEEKVADKSEHTGWWLVGSSAIGAMHVQKNIPCQDSCAIKRLDKDKGVAVVCDGAGSKMHSDLGAQFVSDKASEWLSQVLATRPEVFDEEASVQQLSNELYTYLYEQLANYAAEQELAFDTLGCTLIAVVYQPHTLTCIHIGDGRAAYQDIDGDWHALMNPWNTEEGYTIFLTTKAVHDAPAPRTEYIRSRIINAAVASFVIMSDGCENASFECLILDKETKKYIQPNRPFPQFFNPVKATLVQVHRHYLNEDEEVTKVWTKFLEEGTPQLKNESDDKTMVFAINSVFLKSDEN